MPSVPADVLSLLPFMAWKGLDFPPYDAVKCSFKNALAERLIPYVPGAVHDDMGRHPFKLSAELMFYTGLNAIAPTGEDYFPAYFNRWLPLLVTGEVGTLKHCVLGDVRARVESVDFEIKSTVRSGTKVKVDWTDTVEDPADLNLLGFTNTQLPTTELAAKADAAAGQFGVVYADGPGLGPVGMQFGIQIPQGTISLGIGDVLGAILSVLAIGSLVADALLSAFQGGVASMIDQLFALNSPLTYGATDLLTTFWIALDNKRKQLAATSRKTAVYVTGTKMTIDSVARATGNTILEIIQLNVRLLYTPGVPKGTAVSYFVK